MSIVLKSRKNGKISLSTHLEAKTPLSHSTQKVDGSSLQVLKSVPLALWNWQVNVYRTENLERQKIILNTFWILVSLYKVKAAPQPLHSKSWKSWWSSWKVLKTVLMALCFSQVNVYSTENFKNQKFSLSTHLEAKTPLSHSTQKVEKVDDQV